MLPRRYSSEAIVLARKNYSEADRIINCYSRDYGKLTFLAKGIKKPKSRKRGSLEVFSHIKFAASVGRGFDIVTEVEMIEPFEELRHDLKKVSVAYFVIETVNRLTRDEEKNFELFELILSTIKSIENTTNLRIVREKFISDCLILLGFWPNNKKMENPDSVLESITEREMVTARVAKKILT